MLRCVALIGGGIAFPTALFSFFSVLPFLFSFYVTSFSSFSLFLHI